MLGSLIRRSGKSMMLAIVPALAAVEYGVRINAVSPSLARQKFLDKTTSAELLDRLSVREAFGRAATEVISVSSQHP